MGEREQTMVILTIALSAIIALLVYRSSRGPDFRQLQDARFNGDPAASFSDPVTEAKP